MTRDPASARIIVEAIRARGVADRHGDLAEALRFSVHEAAHALHLHVEPPWTSDAIHFALMYEDVPGILASEGLARATERLVLESLGFEWDAEHWTAIALMEFVRHTGRSFPVGFLAKLIEHNDRCGASRRLADVIMGLEP